jgi:hypothetical protein
MTALAVPPHMTKIESAIAKLVVSDSMDVVQTCNDIISEIYRKSKWVPYETEWYAVSKFNVYVSSSRIREWRTKRTARVPFYTGKSDTNWIVYVPTTLCVPTDTERMCVVCKENIMPGRMIRGCCARHSCHVDCYAVAKVCHGARGCMGGMYEPCEAKYAHEVQLHYDEARLFSNLVDMHLHTHIPTISNPAVRGRAELVAGLVKSTRAWFPSAGYEVEASARYVDRIYHVDEDKPCVMCRNPITEEGLVTCLTHHVHSHCYALWRALRDQAKCDCDDENVVGTAECPGSLFDHSICVCSLKI